MGLSMEAKIDERKFRKFSKEFGDSSEQALIRVGVSAALGAAVKTSPPGKGKKQMIQNIVTGARANIADVPARQFNKIAKRNKPSFRFQQQWVSLRADQLLKSPAEVNDFIEANRDSRGRVKRLKARDKAIAKTGDMNKTLVRRKKLAGVAKGSWLGAGKKLARRARGTERPRVGKNFMSWAQKHADKGTARVRRRGLAGSEVWLISKATHTKDRGVFPDEAGREAVRDAWRKTLGWYRRELKRRDNQ